MYYSLGNQKPQGGGWGRGSGSGSDNWRSAFDELNGRVEEQNLLLQTLLRLLLEKKVVTRDEFRQWMNYVDELDGKRNGRLSRERGVKLCPGCKRKNKVNAFKCLYCDAEFANENFLAHD